MIFSHAENLPLTALCMFWYPTKQLVACETHATDSAYPFTTPTVFSFLTGVTISVCWAITWSMSL